MAPRPSVVIDALRDAFLGLTNGETVQPLQTTILLPDDQGDCIIYSAFVRSTSAIGVKVSPYLVARAEAGQSPVTAFTLVLSSATGEPIALVDSSRLTVERTAATTMLAAQLILRSAPPSSVCVVGVGELGLAHARYVSATFPSSELAVYSPSVASTAPIGVEKREVVLACAPSARIASSLEDAVSDSEVVMLCTSSGTPVVDIDSLRDDVLVTSIGTNAPLTHEIDWQALSSVDVFCDYRRTCPDTAGDMRLAEEAGTWNRSSIRGDLPGLLAGVDSAHYEGRRRYFRSTGLGLEDATIAALIGRSRDGT